MDQITEINKLYGYSLLQIMEINKLVMKRSTGLKTFNELDYLEPVEIIGLDDNVIIQLLCVQLF